MSARAQRGRLQGFEAPVQLRLALLWVATMFCYVYGDYFALYIPGKLASMQAGTMGPLGAVSQGVLFGTAVLMAVPALMTALSLLLPPIPNRIANLVLGLVYTAIMVLVVASSAWRFYQLLGLVEILLTLAIALQAWRWPRVAIAASEGMGPRDGEPA